MSRSARVARVVVFALVLALLGGCASGTGASSSGPVRVDATADGTTVELAPGAELVVALEGNPTTGFDWTVAGTLPPQLTAKSDTIESSAAPGVVGAGGTRVFAYAAAATGTGVLNLEYLRQLDLHIAAGDETLEELNTRRLPAMEVGAKASQDPIVAQQLADFRQAVLRFERRLHDLKLTRTIAIQTAPQIRLIEANNQGLVEKIQTSVTNTIPLWKNQIIIALSLYRQQQALALQKAVSDTTNELLAKNAEMLRTGSAEVARETERGIVDIETLRKVNDDLIATLEETIRIQDEGHARRVQSEVELLRLQSELRKKLVDLAG